MSTLKYEIMKSFNNMTYFFLLITRSAPDQLDGCHLLLKPKDNGQRIECSRKGTTLEISCEDMAEIATAIDVLITTCHCSPTVEKLSVSLKGSYTETGSSNVSCITEATKKDLQRCFEQCIQRGLTSVRLAVKSITQVAGIFPTNMDMVDLKICFLENPVEGELNDWVSSFSSVCVNSLTLAALPLECTVDLEDLFCVLCQNATLLQIKTILDIQHGRVSAERALELIQIDLPYKLEVSVMEVFGVGMLSTLKSLLTSESLCFCALREGPGLQDSLTKDQCKEVLEMREVHQCLSASPSKCDLLTGFLRRVTVCNKPLYWPVCHTLGEVDYVTDIIFPLLEEKCQLFASDYKIKIYVIGAEVHAQIVEIAQYMNIPYEYESDEDEANEGESDENDVDIRLLMFFFNHDQPSDVVLARRQSEADVDNR